VAFCNTLVSPSAAPNGPLLVAETDEDGQTISTGATRTLPGGTLSYPLGMWANYNTVKAIGKLIKLTTAITRRASRPIPAETVMRACQIIMAGGRPQQA
jgi:hypothetical protein